MEREEADELKIPNAKKKFRGGYKEMFIPLPGEPTDKNINAYKYSKTAQKYSKMNDLQKYKEVQRRTKLLYGVKDIKRMIEKSKESKAFFKRDPCNKKAEKKSASNDEDNIDESQAATQS
jgi:hypothetical protein